MKRVQMGLIVAAVVALAGCDISFPTQPSENSSVTVTVNQTNVPAMPAPTPTPDEASGCPAVVTVAVSGFGQVPAPATLAVGATQRLDATPRDADGAQREPECDVAAGITWQVSGPCSLDDPTSFTPTLTALAVGTCEARATVEGVSGALTFAVQ